MYMPPNEIGSLRDRPYECYDTEAFPHSSSLPTARTNKSHTRRAGAPDTCWMT